jgi:hypothetical protein
VGKVCSEAMPDEMQLQKHDQKKIGKQVYTRLTSEWLEQTLSVGKCLHITHQSLLRIYKPETIV